jgi:hypothetical protein
MNCDEVHATVDLKDLSLTDQLMEWHWLQVEYAMALGGKPPV